MTAMLAACVSQSRLKAGLLLQLPIQGPTSQTSLGCKNLQRRTGHQKADSGAGETQPPTFSFPSLSSNQKSVARGKARSPTPTQNWGYLRLRPMVAGLLPWENWSMICAWRTRALVSSPCSARGATASAASCWLIPI
jgi:hypothetical protein